MNDHEYIRTVLIPQVTEHMARGEAHYGPDNHSELGLPGQFSDIYRKIGPLKRALWEGKTLAREQPREICLDLIGHCLLTIAMLDHEVPPVRITGPTQGAAPDKLRAAGWTEENGVWHEPSS